MKLTALLRVACAVVVLLTVGFLAGDLRTSYDSVKALDTSAAYTSAAADAARWACVDQQLHAVPDGTPTYVIRNAVDGEGWQRLVELAVPRLHLVVTKTEAQIGISLQMTGPCGGRQLVITKAPLP